jgi:hypothetical protein
VSIWKKFPPEPASLKNAKAFLSNAGYGKNRLAVASIFLLVSERVFSVVTVRLFGRDELGPDALNPRVGQRA